MTIKISQVYLLSCLSDNALDIPSVLAISAKGDAKQFLSSSEKNQALYTYV